LTEAGQRFAYRERAHTPGDPVRPVTLVKEGLPRSQKLKVRWLDGEYEGLEEWVPKVRLVAPWDEAEALVLKQRRMFAALEASGDVYGTTGLRGSIGGRKSGGGMTTNQKVANTSRLRAVTTITRRGSVGVCGGQEESEK